MRAKIWFSALCALLTLPCSAQSPSDQSQSELALPEQQYAQSTPQPQPNSYQQSLPPGYPVPGTFGQATGYEQPAYPQQPGYPQAPPSAYGQPVPEQPLYGQAQQSSYIPPAQPQYQSPPVSAGGMSGSSSLPPGQYTLTNNTTGQSMQLTVDANGQMLAQDSAQQEGQAGTQAKAASAQQQGPSKLSVVGSALKGALGMYWQYKYGGMMGGYGYPMGYPMGYPSTGGGLLGGIIP